MSKALNPYSDFAIWEAKHELELYVQGPDDGDVGRLFQERLRIVLNELTKLGPTQGALEVLAKTPTLSPLPDFGDHMTRQDFINSVSCGGFIDYDGSGDLATATEVSNVPIWPSVLSVLPRWPEWATHVMWYNK